MSAIAATPPRRFALGVGLTNACNLSCTHCYRGPGIDELTVEQVLAAAAALPTRAVNFGTGESGLHPDFARLVDLLHARGVLVTVTTNGRSTEVLDDVTLAKMSDVEFSIDHPTAAAHDGARGAGNWDLVAAQMARCTRLQVRTTIAVVMMRTNLDELEDLARLAASRGALLRVNVYQSVQHDRFALGFEEFWDGWRRLFAVCDVVLAGEPIVRAMLGWPAVEGAGCGGQTVRITPRGAVVPCVYGGDEALQIADLARLGNSVLDAPAFTRLRVLPAACEPCPHRDGCHGGCASRRSLRLSLRTPDEYCPIVRGVPFEIHATPADGARVSAKGASACTTILRPRV